MKHNSKHIDAQKLEKALYRLAHSTVPSDEFISKTRTQLFHKIEKSSRRPLLNIFSPIYRFSFGAFTALVVLTLFGTIFNLNTLETYAKEVGEVNVTEGEVTIRRNNETLVVHGKADLRIGDVIHVSEDSKAKVSFYKQAGTLLSAKTTVAITDVMETTINGKQEKEIHLSLAEGKLETTPELTQLDTTLHIETEKGIVKAGTDAQVTVSSTDENVLVSVGKDSAEIISPTAQNSTITTLDAGHELALGTTTTLVTPVVIATEVVIPELKTITVSASGATLPEEVPTTSPEKQQYLSQMNGMLEIAEIKLRSSLKFFERGDEIGAYNAALGYTQTVERLLSHLGVAHESLVKNKKDDVVAIRSLSRSYLDQAITALSSKDLDQKEAYTIKARIENLYDVESSVIIFMTTEKTNLHESNTGVANKTNIETTVANVVNTRIDTILAISNPDERAKEFTTYLKSIPNDDHAKKTLLGILNRVPQELKGYVHMKLHDIDAN